MSASVLSANADNDSSDLDENYSISDASDDGSFYDEDIDDFDAISTGEVDLEVPGVRIWAKRRRISHQKPAPVLPSHPICQAMKTKFCHHHPHPSTSPI
jgi:hypothetical protein